MVAGIGFTMAIFVAGLAFADTRTLSAAKLGVLAASLVASVCGLTLGMRILRAPPDLGGAEGVHGVEGTGRADAI
jgi:NhaA family Na+:H+ antiporter